MVFHWNTFVDKISSLKIKQMNKPIQMDAEKLTTKLHLYNEKEVFTKLD
jgi:hypothetical protein